MALSAPLCANDSAASTAAGGIQLKREARIEMAKERLTIGTSKVIVEYEFRNDTDAEIATDIAFPIPPYAYEYDDPGAPRGFDDFKLWVDDKPVKYATEIHATVKGKDLTDALAKYKIDINSFGHVSDKSGDPISTDVSKLSPAAHAELRTLGLIEKEYDYPNWTIVKTYYWHQVFPAHGVLHVRHEYKPVIGFTQIHGDELDPTKRAAQLAKLKPGNPDDVGMLDTLKRVDQACIDPSLAKKLLIANPSHKEDADWSLMRWVDYILTTANSWKTPIHDFELIIEKPPLQFPGRTSYVSVCWDEPLEKVDAIHFRSHIADFVPSKELQVTYLEH